MAKSIAVSGIYEIVVLRPALPAKIYVGQAVDLRKRKIAHWGELRAGRHKNRALQNAFVKYGEASFAFVLIDECSAPDLISREQERLNLRLAEVGRGLIFNIRLDCVASGLGTVRSENTKRKISEALKGKVRSDETRKRLSDSKMGKSLSAEHRRILSEAKRANPDACRRTITAEQRALASRVHSGKVISPEHRKRVSEANTGKIVSDETRRKLSIASTGVKFSEERCAKISAAARAREQAKRNNAV